MKPVVFLDVDGVLTTERWMRSPGYRPMTLDQECVKALNWLTDTEDAQIVVSSTWRHIKLDGGIAAILKREGVTAKVIGKTPDLSYRDAEAVIWTSVTRGTEIRWWLMRHASRPFVILDDDKDMNDLTPHLIRTGFADGLTEPLAELAAQHLDRQRTR